MTGPFDALGMNAERMGRPKGPHWDGPPAEEELPLVLPEPERKRVSVTIGIDELESPINRGGLLCYDGSQVLLYIREQGARVDMIADKPAVGPKYHVAECSTLREMRARNRFGRYVATNDLSGRFEITGIGVSGARKVDVPLNICKNCLRHLNYQDYCGGPGKRRSVFDGFSLPTFFATYSTIFSSLPAGAELIRPGRPANAVGELARIGALTCAECEVRLPVQLELIASVPVDSSNAERPLCIDCRRKPPGREPIHVGPEDMKTIVRERRRLWWDRELSWEEARKYADEAFHGLMYTYERQDYAAPEPGLEIQGRDGSVTVELGLAWPESGWAVVLHEDEANLVRERHPEWEVMTLAEALLDSQEDG